MILASHQPDFFPYMGYFYKMFQCDTFVFSDNVQFSKTGRHDYNEILTPNGPQRLKIPIHYHVAPINQIKLAADETWYRKTKKTLEMAYSKARHFQTAFPVILELLFHAPECKNLAEFNRDAICRLALEFGFADRIWFVQSSDIDLKNRKDARIIEMCKLFQADTYISGVGAKDYHIEEDYKNNGIRLVYSDYTPVRYEQPRPGFVENMSVIDYVMNCGFVLPKEWKRNV